MVWNNTRIYTPSDFQAELWTEEEIAIFELFHFKCVRCEQKAITLHEIHPKSLRPKTWMLPENRVPVCHKCHQWAHRAGTKTSYPILGVLQQWRLREYATQH